MSVREHVPAGWEIIGELPVLPGDAPLVIRAPDGSFELEVEWHLDAFVGGATIHGVESVIRAAAPPAIREWVLGALALVQQRS